jgi:hypothetical protein
MRRCLPCKDILEFEKSPERIKQIIQSAGSNIAALQYIEKSTGALKKVAYKLDCNSFDSTQNDDILLYNCNIILKINGQKKRGDYQRIPLREVTQVTVKGKRFKIQR